MTFTAGLHLGNHFAGPDAEGNRLIREARPGLLLAMENVSPLHTLPVDGQERKIFVEWAHANPDGYLVLRKHFAGPSSVGELAGRVADWANGQAEMVGSWRAADAAFERIYQAGRLLVKVFNEPNIPNPNEWLNFLPPGDQMRHYNEQFPRAVEVIKRQHPRVQAAGLNLTPGNHDVRFPDVDAPGDYWLQESSLIPDALAAMDAFGCHIYPQEPGSWDKPWLGRRFEAMWRYLPKRLRENTFILEGAAGVLGGEQVHADDTRQWLRLLARYPEIKGLAYWWMYPGDITWTRDFLTEPSGRWTPTAQVIKEFNLSQLANPIPTPPVPPTPPTPPTPPPAAIRWDKIAWAMEQTARVLQDEGYKSSHDWILNSTSYREAVRNRG